MLKLKEIKRDNGCITAFYDPENTGLLGYISVNQTTGELIENRVSEYDSDFPVYMRHSVSALMKMLNTEQLPKEKIVMWY